MKLKQILLCGLMVLCCAPLGAQTSKEEMFFHPAYRKRSDGMCRFLCFASAYHPEPFQNIHR